MAEVHVEGYGVIDGAESLYPFEHCHIAFKKIAGITASEQHRHFYLSILSDQLYKGVKYYFSFV